jgi:hypothetical protein
MTGADHLTLPEVLEDLADLLALWWRHEQRNEGARLGFPTTCRSMRGYQARDDRGEESSEGETLELLARAAALTVERLPPDQYAAACIQAQFEATGDAPMRSPAMPADAAERKALFIRTVGALMKDLSL